MSKFRRDAKRDIAEPAIVSALQKAGWEVHRDLPVDLLCIKHRDGKLILKLVEVKTPRGKKNPKVVIDKRQKAQLEFLERHKIPRTCTPFEALLAVGEVVKL